MTISLEQLSAQMRRGEQVPLRHTMQVVLTLSIPSILQQIVVTAVEYIDAAMVMGEPVMKNGIHQSRESKCQQKCQSIHAALSHDRKQQFDHIQSSSFFYSYCERSVSRSP